MTENTVLQYAASRLVCMLSPRVFVRVAPRKKKKKQGFAQCSRIYMHSKAGRNSYYTKQGLYIPVVTGLRWSHVIFKDSFFFCTMSMFGLILKYRDPPSGQCSPAETLAHREIVRDLILHSAQCSLVRTTPASEPCTKRKDGESLRFAKACKIWNCKRLITAN